MLGYPGLSEKDRKTIQSFLSQCKITDINKTIKEEVIRLRSVYKIKLPDAIVVASAIYLDLPLITSDTGFKKLETELNLIHYER